MQISLHNRKDCFVSSAKQAYFRVHPPWGGGGGLQYKRLMGMCRSMGSHFYDLIDYNGVSLSIESLEWGRTFSDFWCKKGFHIYG